MLALLLTLLHTLRSALRTRAELARENLTLRQQLAALHPGSAFVQPTAPSLLAFPRSGPAGEPSSRRASVLGSPGQGLGEGQRANPIADFLSRGTGPARPGKPDQPPSFFLALRTRASTACSTDGSELSH